VLQIVCHRFLCGWYRFKVDESSHNGHSVQELVRYSHGCRHHLQLLPEVLVGFGTCASCVNVAFPHSGSGPGLSSRHALACTDKFSTFPHTRMQIMACCCAAQDRMDCVLHYTGHAWTVLSHYLACHDAALHRKLVDCPFPPHTSLPSVQVHDRAFKYMQQCVIVGIQSFDGHDDARSCMFVTAYHA
jgi:hypothetical protein